MDHNNILGTVLAGGKSQRFGQDKSQVKLNGKILIDYILSEIIDEFNEVLIVTNDPIKHLSSEKIQKRYFHEYNTTLNGMIKNHKIDAEEFLEFVHDVDLNFLKSFYLKGHL